jgi:mono/diheme cytochrome c family protein
MKRKLFVSALIGLAIISCQKKEEGQVEQKEQKAPTSQTSTTTGTGKNEKSGQVNQTLDIGIGPIKKVEISNKIDQEMAKKGEGIFKMKCSMCHKLDEKYVGPPLKGVTLAMKPEWIMNMILNPVEMTQKDPVAKALYETYLTQMTPQNLSEEEARAVLEYLRSVDNQSK